MNNKNTYIVCFGEILWDIFPDGEKAGGAPFNAAYHIKKMGIEVKMLSRIGNDELGKKLTDRMKGWGITTSYIQEDLEHPTSTVLAKIDEHHEASYEIINHVAWDYIEFLPEHEKLVSEAEAFIFGSLSARNEKTRETLLKLLKSAKLKVFDVNFRPPFIDVDLIRQLLHHADIVKMNKSEMRQIMEFLGKEYKSEEETAAFIQKHFDIREIILTKGSKGARYFTGDTHYDFAAVPIEIADTVGSGDAFLSGFISKRILGGSPEEMMNNAVSLGAWITSKYGACPGYDLQEFEAFKNKQTDIPGKQ